MPINNCFFVCYNPVGFLNAKSFAFRPSLWLAGLKIEVFCFSGKSWELGVPSQLYVTIAGWSLWWEYVSAFSTHFSLDIFSVAQHVRVIQLFSGSLPGRIAPCVAIYLVHLQDKGNSGGFHLTILIQSPRRNVRVP